MGINPNRKAHWFLGLHPDEITLAERCRQAGYKTFILPGQGEEVQSLEATGSLQPA